MKKFRHLRITQDNLHLWQEQLSLLEGHFSYPFGDDEFKLSHGENYLAFFERYGQLHYYAMAKGDQLVAVAAAVRHTKLKAWYLGDLKVHPDHRGNSLTKKMFLRHFLPCYLKCQRGFALTMLNDVGPQNKVITIMEKLPFTPLKLGAVLNFYLEEAEVAARYLHSLGGDYSFIDLKGKKELIMKKTGAPLPLLHLERSTKSGGDNGITEGYLHMWCLPQNHPSADKLKLTPKARGYILQHGMGNQDWTQLQTSEL